MTAPNAPMSASAEEVLKAIDTGVVCLEGFGPPARFLRDARAAVAAMAEREAALIAERDAYLAVLREFQDGRRISNPHTRQVARDIEQQALARAGVERAERDALVKEVEALRADAERWRHARMLLTVDDIEGMQGAYDSFGRMVSEEECKRADAAIDAARAEARK